MVKMGNPAADNRDLQQKIHGVKIDI